MTVRVRYPLRLGVYAVAALLVVAPALASAERYYGASIDLYGTLWFFWWIRRCVETLSDPGFTPLFFHPFGKDVFAHTGNNFVDALASVPLQWALGPRHYYDALLALVLFGNAAAMDRLARLFTGSEAAAGVAGLAFLFSPFALDEVRRGRPTQAMLWFAVLALYYAFQTSWRRRALDPYLGGACLALAGWTYWFAGFFVGVAVLGIAAVEVWGGEAPGAARGDGEPRRRALLLARYARLLGVVALGVAPAVLGMLHRGEAGPISAVPDLRGATMEQFLAHPAVTLMHNESWRPFVADSPVRLGYGSWWIAAGAGVAVAARGPRRPRILAIVALIALFLVVSLGPLLDAGGGAHPLPHYVFALRRLPLFARFWFPYRALCVVWVLLPLLVGLLVAWAPRGRRPVVALTLGILLPGEAILRLGLVSPPTTTLPERPAYGVIAAAGGGVIELPFGVDQLPIAYQTRHGQPLLGGMGEANPQLRPRGFDERARRSALLRFLIDACARPVPAPVPDSSWADLVREGFRWVALHRDVLTVYEVRRLLAAPGAPGAYGAPAVRTSLTAVLGPPLMVDGPVLFWFLAGPPPEAAAAFAPDDSSLARWDAGGGFPYTIPDELRPKPAPALGPGHRPSARGMTPAVDPGRGGGGGGWAPVTGALRTPSPR